MDSLETSKTTAGNGSGSIDKISSSIKSVATKKQIMSLLNLNTFKFATKMDFLLLLIAILMNTAQGVAMPLTLVIFGQLVNSISENNLDKTNTFVLLQVYIGIGAFVVGTIAVACIDIAAERQIREIRYHYLKAVLRQEAAWFDTHEEGSLSSVLNQNCIAIRDGIGMKFGQIFMFFASFIGGYVVGFTKNWKMTLVLSAALPLLAFAGFFLVAALGSAERKAVLAYAKAGGVAEEVLSNMRTIAAFSAEEKSINRYSLHLNASLRAGIRGSLYLGFGFALTFFIMFLSYALGFWYGGEILANQLEPPGCQNSCLDGGTALTVFFAIIIAAMSLGQAGPATTAFIKAGSAATSLTELINRKSEIDPYDPNGYKQDSPLEGEFVFKDIKFRYPTRVETTVFENLNLRIPAGKAVALVGASGCGKSTIVQLIQRFYDVEDGSILLDNRPLDQYNVKWLRDQMSVVSQEPKLFARSINDNIRDGRAEATQNEVEMAASQANAKSFIDQFPNGLNTFVGESGSQLSGGQKQRIAIARAMVRNPPILILDEATSALDTESEKVVQATLDELLTKRKRTTIIVAHRLTTIREADHIIVLHNPTGNGAEVAEEGKHDELMSKPNGIYKSLVEMQTQSLSDKKKGKEDQLETLKNQLSREYSLKENVQSKKSSTSERKSSFALNQAISQPIEMSRSLASKIISRQPSIMYEGKIMRDSSIATLNKGFHNMIKKEKDSGPSYSRLIKLLIQNHPFQFMLGILGSIGAGVVFPLFALFFSKLLSTYFIRDQDQLRKQKNFWSLMFVVIAIGSFTTFFIQKFFMDSVGHRIVKALREKVFNQLVYQDMEFFDSPDRTSGALSDVLSKDTMLVKGYTGDNIGIIIQNATCVITGICIAFTGNAKLAAVSLAAFITIIPAAAIEIKFMEGGTKNIEKSVEAAGQFINESITNIKVVMTYNLQDKISQLYYKKLDTEYRLGRRNALIGGFFWGISQFVQFGSQALTLWYAGVLIRNQESDIEKAFQSIFAIMMAATSLGHSLTFVTDITKAKQASKRVFDILDRKSKIDVRSSEGQKLTPEQFRPTIELNDVSFCYTQRQDVQVFSHLNLKVKEGETIALVGASGCGKSTIIQLVERFYDVTTEISPVDGKVTSGGQVNISHVDCRHLNLRTLRNMLGLVGQEPVLFDTTIEENILYGKPDATKEEVISAAKKANAHNFISQFPEQYETSVGRLGGQISGGQKQRIAIARAIIRDPKILLLDEATSALDAESEAVVQEALDALVAESKTKRTTIIVAHRLSTIQNASRIIVFGRLDPSQGSVIVEQGTHQELMNITNGVYRKLVELASEKKDF